MWSSNPNCSLPISQPIYQKLLKQYLTVSDLGFNYSISVWSVVIETDPQALLWKSCSTHYVNPFAPRLRQNLNHGLKN